MKFYLRKLVRRFLLLTIQRMRVYFYWLISEYHPISKSVAIMQPLYLSGAGKIIFEERVKFGVRKSPSFMNGYSYIEAREKESMIKIGMGSWINNSFTAIALRGKIIVGNNCLIGNNVTIYSSDFHPLSPKERWMPDVWPVEADVVIGNNVFLGSQSMIMKGTNLGDGCVVAAGAIVAGKFPKNTIIAGNPARIIRHV